MIFSKEIFIPIVNQFNWGGIEYNQIYDFQRDYCVKAHRLDLNYFQFRGIINKTLVLRLRNEYDEVIETYPLSVLEYSGNQYPFVYDCYYRPSDDLEDGFYYLDIYEEAENKIYAYCDYFILTDDCERHPYIEAFNDYDKDGFIFTRTSEFGTYDSLMASFAHNVRLAETNSPSDYLPTDFEFLITGNDFWGTKLCLLARDHNTTFTPDLDFTGYLIENGNVVGTMFYKGTFDDVDGTSIKQYWFVGVDGNNLNPDFLINRVCNLEIESGGYKFISENISAKYKMISEIIYPQYMSINILGHRIECNFRQDELELQSTINEFTDQALDSRVTSSVESEVQMLTIGSVGVPVWCAIKYNRYFGLNNLFYEGKAKSRTGEIKVDKEGCSIGYQILKIPLQDTDHPEFERDLFEAFLLTENGNPISNENNKSLTL